MKSLNAYIDDKTSAILDKHGAFFAFSQKTFEKKRKEEHIPYISLDGGLICPQANVQQMVDEIDTVIQEGIKQRLEDYGLEAIILYELNNFECFYTGNIEEAVERMAEYGATYEQVLAVYNDNKAAAYKAMGW